MHGKILIAILGLDQHEVGAMAVASALRDAGLEVIYLGRFNLPAAIVHAASQEDAAVIGLSAHSWEYLYYIDELLGDLRRHGLDIPVLVGGSVVTPADAEGLRERGVHAAFGPGASMQAIVEEVRGLLGPAQASAGSDLGSST